MSLKLNMSKKKNILREFSKMKNYKVRKTRTVCCAFSNFMLKICYILGVPKNYRYNLITIYSQFNNKRENASPSQKVLLFSVQENILGMVKVSVWICCYWSRYNFQRFGERSHKTDDETSGKVH